MLHPSRLPPLPPKRPWLLATCCAISCAAIIASGLAILATYLALRPKPPQFDIPSATLASLRLNGSTLLDLDLTFAANFTNPNRRPTRLDFSDAAFGLYFRDAAVASGAVGPSFSVAKREWELQSVHVAVAVAGSGVVGLEDDRVGEMRREMDGGVMGLEVRGRFRAKAWLGRLLRYQSWVRTRCFVNLTGPPNGTLVWHKCY